MIEFKPTKRSHILPPFLIPFVARHEHMLDLNPTRTLQLILDFLDTSGDRS